MTGAEIVAAGNSGRASWRANQLNKRQQEEQEYLMRRRAAEDPYKDAEQERINAGRNAIMDLYGPQAGDPNAWATAQGANSSMQKLPGQLESQNIQNAQARFGLDAAKDQKIISDMSQTGQLILGVMEQGGTIEQALGAIPPELAMAIGLDENEMATLSRQFQENPEEAMSVMKTLAAGDPATIHNLFKALSEDGQTVTRAAMSDGTTRDLGAVPPEQMSELDQANIRLKNAQAAKALADARKVGKSGTSGGSTPGEMDADLRKTISSMSLTSAALDRQVEEIEVAMANGSFRSEKNSWLTNFGIMDNAIGDAVGKQIGSKEVAERERLDSNIKGILGTIIRDSGLSARLFDTQAEKDFWIDQLTAATTGEEYIRVLRRFQSDLDTMSEMLQATGGDGIIRRRPDGTLEILDADGNPINIDAQTGQKAPTKGRFVPNEAGEMEFVPDSGEFSFPKGEDGIYNYSPGD